MLWSSKNDYFRSAAGSDGTVNELTRVHNRRNGSPAALRLVPRPLLPHAAGAVEPKYLQDLWGHVFYFFHEKRGSRNHLCTTTYLLGR